MNRAQRATSLGSFPEMKFFNWEGQRMAGGSSNWTPLKSLFPCPKDPASSNFLSLSYQLAQLCRSSLALREVFGNSKTNQKGIFNPEPGIRMPALLFESLSSHTKTRVRFPPDHNVKLFRIHYQIIFIALGAKSFWGCVYTSLGYGSTPSLRTQLVASPSVRLTGGATT